MLNCICVAYNLYLQRSLTHKTHLTWDCDVGCILHCLLACTASNFLKWHLRRDTFYLCRVVGATYANGWLIIVGASKTSPVPGSGMRRRHARRRILPSFRALRGDNTPSPALRGLRMITRFVKVATIAPRAVGIKGEEEQG